MPVDLCHKLAVDIVQLFGSLLDLFFQMRLRPGQLLLGLLMFDDLLLKLAVDIDKLFGALLDLFF